MDYNISYQLDENILIAEVKGVRQKKTEAQFALNAIKEIADKLKETGLNKVITVWKIKGAISPDQSLILIANLEKCNWKKQFATASVHPFKDNFDSHAYTAKVINTLKWNIRFFQDLEIARNWLKKVCFEEFEAAE